MIVRVKKYGARIIAVLQYVGSSLELLPDDPDCLPVNHTA
jgi:hypothetical protein